MYIQQKDFPIKYFQNFKSGKIIYIFDVHNFLILSSETFGKFQIKKTGFQINSKILAHV